MNRQQLYKQTHSHLSLQGDKNFCGPLALAAVFDADVDQVNSALIRSGSRVKGKGTNMWNVLSTMQKEGAVECIQDVYESGHKTITSATRALPTGRYLILVRNHVLALIDGEVQDWSAGSKHRVEAIYKVIGTTSLFECGADKIETTINKPTFNGSKVNYVCDLLRWATATNYVFKRGELINNIHETTGLSKVGIRSYLNGLCKAQYQEYKSNVLL
ncbi:hypothetical protein [Endozoicomonas sp. ALB032]|uniref:hypothetical protein n=1 Tax=Endozoicomonas sp. ALB032 TaxID=3403082 RepID=UPI003BB763F8